jgi:two-component system chemotaxis sensor kinase CheA
LAIIPCLIVRSGGQRYAIPQKDLEELVCLHPDLTSTTIEATVDRELVRLRDRLLPLVRLEDALSQPQPFDAARRREIVKKHHGADCIASSDAKSLTLFAVVKAGSRRFGIIVEEILKSEEIVVKPMHGSLKPLSCFSGATIMGDGLIALILNVEGIAQHAGIRLSEQFTERKGDSAKTPAENAALLLFEHGPEEQFAVPLASIRRLTMLDRERIERVGEQEFIAIDDLSLPILRLDRILPVSPAMASGLSFLILPKNLSRPLGILASSIIDTESLPENFTVDAFRADGVLGTAILRGRMTLFLDVPRLAEIAESKSKAPAPPASPPSPKGRILLAEDTEFFRVLVAGYLKNENYEVTTAINGAEALRSLEAETFDVVISDIEMPEMDGWTFAQNVRQNAAWNHLPLLALTTLSSAECREKAKRCGFDGFLVKLDRAELLAAVAEMLELRRYCRANPVEARK